MDITFDFGDYTCEVDQSDWETLFGVVPDLVQIHVESGRVLAAERLFRLQDLARHERALHHSVSIGGITYEWVEVGLVKSGLWITACARARSGNSAPINPPILAASDDVGVARRDIALWLIDKVAPGLAPTGMEELWWSHLDAEVRGERLRPAMELLRDWATEECHHSKAALAAELIAYCGVPANSKAHEEVIRKQLARQMLLSDSRSCRKLAWTVLHPWQDWRKEILLPLLQAKDSSLRSKAILQAPILSSEASELS